MHQSNHFYGHARVLARYAGLTGDPPIFGLLQHGWNADHGIRDTSWLPAWFPKLLWNQRALELAEADGERRAIAIGAPFLYLLEERKVELATRRAASTGTVAFPYHFWEEQGGTRQDEELADELLEREDGPVTVCLYWFDHANAQVRRVYADRGFRVVSLGERHEPGFSDGLFDLVAGAARVVSNRASTALWCGGAAGADVSIYGPAFALGSDDEGVAFARLQRQRWPELCEGSVTGDDARALGRVELGAEHVREPADLREVLGWESWRRAVMRVGRVGLAGRAVVRHRMRPPTGARSHAQDILRDQVRDLHVVVPTIGRPTTVDVLAQQFGEQRVARITVVSQDCGPVVDEAVRAEAAARRIVLEELVVADRIGCARARRLGAAEGDEQWLGFVDDDIHFVSGGLGRLMEACEDHGWAGASGSVVDDPRNTRAYRLLKRALFHGPFADPRPAAAASGRTQTSRVLSGGLTVFRRDVYEQVAEVAEQFDGYSWGEDVMISLAASEVAPLGLVPTVRAQNRTLGSTEAGGSALGSVAERYAWYRRLAVAHARSRRDRAAHLGAILGATVQGLREAPWRPVLGLAAAEARWGVRRLARGASSDGGGR